MSFVLPKNILRTRCSPYLHELEFIYTWCKDNITQGTSVLEFGAGSTTFAIYTAINPSIYIAVEDWAPAIENITKYINDIHIIQTSWNDIPEIEYGFIFVDSSSGFPGRKGLHRHDAIKYSERYLQKNGFVMIHDWCKPSGKYARKYLDDSSDYKLVASFLCRSGVGVYKKL